MIIIDFIHNLATAIAEATDKPKPEIKLMTLTAQQVLNEMGALGIQVEVTPRDYEYSYLSSEDWAKVFSYIYFDFSMPSYIAERMDCDDFAFLMKSLCSALFGINTIGAAMGMAPLGMHQWNIFRTDNGWMQIEPQTGKIFEIGQEGYKADWILI